MQVCVVPVHKFHRFLSPKYIFLEWIDPVMPIASQPPATLTYYELTLRVLKRPKPQFSPQIRQLVAVSLQIMRKEKCRGGLEEYYKANHYIRQI